jgi:hypothetical protein
MTTRGVLFAIDDEQLARLGEARDDVEIGAILDEIEEQWDRGHLCEMDKAWDVIHRVLTDGRLEFGNGKRPLSLAILGGRRLYDGDDRIVTVKTADETAAIARALVGWDRARFRQAYYRIPKHDYGDLDEEDLGYAWAYFGPMCEFWKDAARDERAVVFTA